MGRDCQTDLHVYQQLYEKNLNRSCFPGSDPMVCRIFPETYEALDPGCCLVAESGGKLIGSCFYHPRESHVAIGIMNAAQGSTGKGVAKALLDEVIRRAGDLPIRLVSSAMNLDSLFTLYQGGLCTGGALPRYAISRRYWSHCGKRSCTPGASRRYKRNRKP